MDGYTAAGAFITCCNSGENGREGSDCLRCQAALIDPAAMTAPPRAEKGEGRAASSGFHGICCRSTAFSMMSNLRIQAVSATLGFLPVAINRA